MIVLGEKLNILSNGVGFDRDQLTKKKILMKIVGSLP
jgi:hypothetical protein